jgi:RNA polymerase sigma-70 factor (ECF subfamily)
VTVVASGVRLAVVGWGAALDAVSSRTYRGWKEAVVVSEAMGPQERFGALYDTHRAALGAYCRRRLPVDVVDDVLAEIFLTAWRRIDEIPTESELVWLYRVARNVVANQRRGLARRVRLVARVLTLRSVPDVELDASPIAQDRWIVDALSTLSSADQELIRLRAWEELTSADIAVVLGITAAAVDMRLNRARRRLERALSSMGNIDVRGVATVASKGVS